MSALNPRVPHNLEAEQATLGSMLLAPAATGMALGLLGDGDFYPEHHQRIFRAMREVHGQNEPVDLVTVTERLRGMGVLEHVGGAEYLTALLNTVPTAAHVARYATLVAEKAVLRRLAEQTATVTEQAMRPDADPVQVAYALEQTVAQAQGRMRPPESARPVTDFLHGGYYERLNAERQALWTVEGPRFGLGTTDHLTGGLANEELVIVKAPEKFGKTTLLRQSALETALWCFSEGNGQAVVVYLLEGSRHQWLNGALACLGNLRTETLLRGGEKKSSNEERDGLVDAEALLPKLPLLLTDGLRQMHGIAADVQCLQSEGRQLAAVYVDYAGLVHAPGDGHERAINIAQGLLELATDAHVPVFAGSQITLLDGGARRSRWGPELEFNASSVWQIERGERGQKNQDEARRSDLGRLVNTHRRYGEALPPLELWLDFAHARIRPLADKLGVQPGGTQYDGRYG